MNEKRCVNCKFHETDGFDYPCNECKYDDYGEPRHWEAAAVVDEMVDHPAHYNHGNYECIDIMVDVFGKEATQHFCLLSAFKYIWRKDYKGGIEDIRKSWWYLDKYLELEGEAHE